MAIIFIIVVVAVVAYLFLTKNGQKIKSRASGTITEKIKEDAATPEGAKARFNEAIKDGQEFYRQASNTYMTVCGKLETMKENLHNTKKNILKTETQINQCLDRNDEKTATVYAEKLVTLKKNREFYEEKIKELQVTADKQEEIRDRAYDKLVKLKDEKDQTILQMETDKQIAELQQNLDEFNKTSVAQEALEEVREGAQKLNEKAKGSTVAYESSQEALDYRMEQEEKQREVASILENFKNSRKN